MVGKSVGGGGWKFALTRLGNPERREGRRGKACIVSVYNKVIMTLSCGDVMSVVVGASKILYFPFKKVLKLENLPFYNQYLQLLQTQLISKTCSKYADHESSSKGHSTAFPISFGT